MTTTLEYKKASKVTLSGNLAVAHAVKQADVDVVSAYPITPSTTVAEKLSEYVANGELDANFIPVESEHSAISAASAAAASGARAFTATSSQGLLLMHEILFITSAFRLPVVMAVANRSISAPINIWCDHGDVMAQRDSGWIQIFVESVQETYDKVIQAFRIAEDRRVRLPVMVNYDGVVLSHTYEPMTLVPDKDVLDFCPRVEPPFKIDPKNPITMGAFADTDYYFESRCQQAKALEESLEIVGEVDSQFGELTGRKHETVSKYFAEDAELMLIAMGSLCGTIRVAVKKLRKEGVKAGLLSLKVFRPFPTRLLLEALEGAKAVGVVDRALTPGGIAGPLYTDMASSLYPNEKKPLLLDFVAGLGGRDVKLEDILSMYSMLRKTVEAGRVKENQCFIGLKGGEE